MKRVIGGRQTIFVWRNIQLVRGRVFLFTLLFLSAVLLFALNEYLFATLGLLMIPLAYVLGIYSYRTYLIWNSGLEGERAVNRELDRLPDTYSGQSGVVLQSNRGDIDHVVVGPNGIFVIESKNYGGNISCDGDQWRKTRRITNEKSIESTIGSPSRQVKRNAKVLKDFLLERQYEAFGGPAPHLWLHAILVFTNPRATLELKDPTVDVVQLSDLVDAILSAKSPYCLTPETVRLISETISNR